jgi:hypothetical protein
MSTARHYSFYMTRSRLVHALGATTVSAGPGVGQPAGGGAGFLYSEARRRRHAPDNSAILERLGADRTTVMNRLRNRIRPAE